MKQSKGSIITEHLDSPGSNELSSGLLIYEDINRILTEMLIS